jgi:hypothetical protein
MTVQLTDWFSVHIGGEERDGKVVEMTLHGSVNDPDEVTVRLDSGVKFTIPWEQYQRGEE